ncbi:hypothetical protein [Streptomyces sp. SYSU K217416]
MADSTLPKHMSRRKAREIADSTELVKSADWSETREWNVTAADGSVLVVVSPSYGGASRTGRNGWRYRIAALGPSGSREHWPTRQAAAVQGLMAWTRLVTSPS